MMMDTLMRLIVLMSCIQMIFAPQVNEWLNTCWFGENGLLQYQQRLIYDEALWTSPCQSGYDGDGDKNSADDNAKFADF